MAFPRSLRAVLPALALAAAFAAAAPAEAQTYPNRPIRIIVPFTPGGSTDIAARIIGERIAPALGQSVVIENRPGANGGIGADAAARAAPDGYTLFLGNLGTLGINPAIYPNLPYDPSRDFAPVVRTAVSPLVLIVSPQSGINSVADLIARGKAQPGTLTFSSAGNGSAAHFAAELFNHLNGMTSVHVPYNGAAPATAAIAAGDVNYSFSGQGPSWPLVDGGRLRALGLTGSSRSQQRPNVPTVAEAGVAGYEMVDWNGILVPAATPRAIVDRLNAEIVKALSASDIQSRFAEQGLQPAGNTPEEFAAFIRAEQTKWLGIARAANIKVE
jgi:tripartite-type tricarboxylate transporter receptor subunit TctC